MKESWQRIKIKLPARLGTWEIRCGHVTIGRSL